MGDSRARDSAGGPGPAGVRAAVPSGFRFADTEDLPDPDSADLPGVGQDGDVQEPLASGAADSVGASHRDPVRDGVPVTSPAGDAGDAGGSDHAEDAGEAGRGPAGGSPSVDFFGVRSGALRPGPPAAGSAWSPLPRSWVPSSGTRDEVTGVDPDARPAWSPTSAVRHPDFGRPPTPAGPGNGAGLPPDPSLSWSAPMAPGGTSGAARPVVTFGRPEGFRDGPRAVGRGARTVMAAASVVLGLGLIGGSVTGSWLLGDSGGSARRDTYTTAGGLWHNVPVDRLFPATVVGQGAGPGGADRTWTRIAVAPDSGCADVFDPLLRQALSSVGCRRVLRATYTDATQSYVTTVGLLFTTADARAMRALETRFDKEGLAKRTDLMPRPYAVKDTAAAAFGDRQRASWTISVLTDAPVVVTSVSGWADGRRVDSPQPAREATASGATTAPAQAGLGNEAQGLADRVERALRKNAVAPPSEQPTGQPTGQQSAGRSSERSAGQSSERAS